MKWILLVVLTAAIVGLVAVLIGSRLAQSHRASISQTFSVAPDVIWSTITDIDAFPLWRAGISGIERLPDKDGYPVWIEEGRSGKMTLAVERMEAPRILVGRIADPNLPFGGAWTYEIAPDGAGTRLTITENGEIYNPLFRFLARFIFGYDSTIRTYMASLEKRLVRLQPRS